MALERWKTVRVKDLCELGRGRVISIQEIQDHPGEYPVFSSQSSNRGELGGIDTFDFEGEYVTWTTDGAYAGTVFYRNGKFNCTNVCGTLKAKSPDLSMLFLAYKLSTVAKHHVSYVGNPKLMNNAVAQIKLALPVDKDEQTQIAVILSTIDKAIEQTETIIEKQTRIKTGLMQDLLTKGIDEHGNMRSEETHEFKDSRLGRIPVEWDLLPMQKLTTKIVDGVHHTPVYIEDGIPFLTVTDLTAGRGISFKNVRYITVADHKQFIKRADPRPGDVLVTKDGTLGVARVVPDAVPEFSIFVSVALLRPNLERASPELIASFFETSEFSRQLGRLSAGTGLRHIHLEHFREFLVRTPPIPEQKRIFSVLGGQNQLIDTFDLDLEKLRWLRIGLMQDLLTGKVRVTHLLNKEKLADTA